MTVANAENQCHARRDHKANGGVVIFKLLLSFGWLKW